MRHTGWLKHERYLASELQKSCVKADPTVFAAWLIGHLNQGGEITHRYPRKVDALLLCEKPKWIPALHGANSVEIIIPSGLLSVEDLKKLSGPDGLGHSRFFFMDGYRSYPDIFGPFVPIYADVLRLLPWLEKESLVRA